jgi:hypothetical protein
MDTSSIIILNDEKNIARIEKQIALVNKLLVHVNYDKVIRFLSKNELFTLNLISRHFPLDEFLLSNYTNDFKWGFNGISSNPNIIWTNDLLKKFSSLLSWTSLSWHSKNPLELLSFQEVKWDGISLNRNINWSIDFIDEHLEKLKFNHLSGNPSLPWSFLLIERYKTRWNWDGSGLSIFNMSRNPGLPWSELLLEKYFDKWNWEDLSSNIGIPWSVELLEKYKSKWTWGIGGLSKNASLPWSVSLIEKYKEKWHWGNLGLSSNEGLNWSLQLLRKYMNQWNEDGLSTNEGIFWTQEMINEVKSWGYGYLNPYSNKNAPWSIDYINKNEEAISFYKIYLNESLWETVFKNVIDYQVVVNRLDLFKNRINYKPFLERKQYDEIFDDFLFNKDPFWFSCVSKEDIKLIEEYFNNKYRLCKYIESEQAYTDLIENKKTLSNFQNMVNEDVPDKIKELLSKRINSQASQLVFKQDHEMMKFLNSNLILPDYFANHNPPSKDASSKNSILNWAKRIFMKY